jgi:hypothetical protein
MTKLTMTSKYTSVAAHFEGLLDAPEQYRQHCPMRHVQGYPGSHWTPPLGNHLLCIAPAATRAIANETTTKKWINFAGHFDGHSSAAVRYCINCPTWLGFPISVPIPGTPIGSRILILFLIPEILFYF